MILPSFDDFDGPEGQKWTVISSISRESKFSAYLAFYSISGNLISGT